MKILKFLFVFFLVFFVLVVAGLVIFFKTFDVNRFKPQILSQAEKSLGRKVDFDSAKLVFSLRHGVSLGVSNLVIADDPAFSKDNFLTVKDIALSVDVLGYLSQKKITVSDISVDGFSVKIIRRNDGSINVATIAQPAGSTTVEQKPAGAQAAFAPALPVFLISSFKATNGEISYIDHANQFPMEVTVSDLALTLSKISLTDKFPFSVEARILSEKKNVSFEGFAQFDLSNTTVTLSDCKGRTDLSQILLGSIPVSFPMIQTAVLPVSLEGKAGINLEKMTAGQAGLTVLTGRFSLADAAFAFKQMAAPVDDIVIEAEFTQKKILINKASASVGEGIIKAAGSLDNYLTSQEFSAELTADSMQIADLVAADMLPVKARGVSSARMELQGKGFSPQALSSFLSGTGAISLKQVTLQDLNLFDLVLSKLTMVPGLAGNIEAAMPERYKKLATQKDTVLSDFELPITIQNGRLVIKDASVSSEGFSLKSSTAELGFDSTYAMEGAFLIPGDLSVEMAAKIPALEYLLNEDKQIFIPLKVSGKATQAALTVDAGYIAKKLVTDQIKTQLIKVIDKAIGSDQAGEEGVSDPQGAGEAEGASESEQLTTQLFKVIEKAVGSDEPAEEASPNP